MATNKKYAVTLKKVTTQLATVEVKAPSYEAATLLAKQAGDVASPTLDFVDWATALTGVDLTVTDVQNLGPVVEDDTK